MIIVSEAEEISAFDVESDALLRFYVIYQSSESRKKWLVIVYKAWVPCDMEDKAVP